MVSNGTLINKALIAVFQPSIEEMLDPKDIAHFYTDWPRGTWDAIVQQTTAPERARKFIAYLIRDEVDLTSAEFQIFLDALDQYDPLKRLIRGDNVHQYEAYLKILRLLAPEIQNAVVVNYDLLEHLVAKGAILEVEKEEILGHVYNGRSRDGLTALVRHLPRRIENWPEVFTNALHKSGNECTLAVLFGIDEDDDEAFTSARVQQKHEDLLLQGDPQRAEAGQSNGNFEGQKLEQAKGGNDDDGSTNEKYDTEACKEAPIEKEKLELRDYQRTLALPGINGENTIICAPTGSGKTVVAAAIMENHLRKNPKNKVVFLACDVALANQQCREFKKFLSDFNTIERSGDSDDAAPVKILLETNDIVVLTAQLLVNSMSRRPTDFGGELDIVTFDDFTMIVFDECHHCDRGHPYNILMGKYVDMKLAGKKGLPQVLGLTASLGVKKAANSDDAIKHIIKMCANLDAHMLSYPDELMKKQIENFANTPTMKTFTAPRRNPDPFLDLVTDMMKEIERRLVNVCNVGGAPAEKGIQLYIQWVSEAIKDIVESTNLADLNRKRALKYLQYLKIYNKALIINHECRTRDALEYLRRVIRWVDVVKITEMNIDDFFDEESDSDSDDDDDDGDESDDAVDTEKDPEQRWLEQLFRDQEPAFDEISRDPHNKNPMLELLKVKLLEKYTDVHSGMESSGIIFVETREMTRALCRWIREDNDLKGLNPELLVGANNKSDGATKITQAKQLDTLKQFKGGVHKVIVATSVAEEGLDIKKCNWVIPYNKVTNEIAMVQSRGRARADNSTFDVVTGGTEGHKKAAKQKMNMLREIMMMRSLDYITSCPREKYQEEVRKAQREESNKRKIKEAVRAMEVAEASADGPHYILCKFCKRQLCRADELRKLAGTHHSVISDGFQDKYVTTLLMVPKVIADFEIIGKIFCSDCNDELGGLAMYRSVKFPLLKIKSLLLKCPEGGTPSYKKWKEVPIQINDLTHEEMEKMIASCIDKK